RLNRLLVLVGPRASGKTSLLFGRLLPYLKHRQDSQHHQNDEPAQKRWDRYLTLVPGSHPLVNLALLIQKQARQLQARAVAGSTVAVEPPADTIASIIRNLRKNERYLVQEIGESESVLLVVDQFEELFTLCNDGAIRKAFIENLLSLIQPPEDAP